MRMASSPVVLVVALASLATPQALPPSDCTLDAPNHLSCRLSSINSRLERTDFSVIPNTTTSLRVLCSQTDVGSLPPSAFSSLTSLRHLSLQGCALDLLPAGVFRGLHLLEHLQVSTGSLAPLRVEAGALRHLPRLATLDLSTSTVRSLPAGELCALHALTTLNMSANELGSLHDLGVSATLHNTCLPLLASLDVSNNELSMVELETLLSWPSITSLNLSSNYIRFVADSVLANSTALVTLDMSNNQMSHLPPALLAGLPLRDLLLANNSLSSLPANLLANHIDLELLDLSGNILMVTGLPTNLTADLHNLISLNLCSNQLTELPLELTSPLQNLNILKVCNNNLAEISLSPAMINLVELDMSGNTIHSLSTSSSLPFSQLTYLSLARNQLAEVESTVFTSIPGLLVLDLSENRLTSLPEALTILTSLQTVDISHNLVSDIEEATLAPLTSLWRLQINGNQLRNISRSTFSSLASLQILDLSTNQLEAVEGGAFDSNLRLKAVRLDGNRLTAIHGLFSAVPELMWLNVSDNSIKAFDYSMVPSTLTWLDISHNMVPSLASFKDLHSSSITYLDASFNRLVRLESTSFPAGLETLLLNDNQISTVAPYTFFHLTRLVKADLSVNDITSLTENSLRLSADALATPSFNLGGNPIACDCHMQWFQEINSETAVARYPHITDLEAIYCQLMNTPAKTFIPLVEARPEQFLCQYQTHCFSLCQCCQFDSCDCEMTCPDGCSCYHDNSWSQNIIQCSNNAYQGVPSGLPMDATEISLDGNDLTQLKSHSLIGRKNLRVLHLNNSNIEKIENKTFNGLKSLRSLHLEDNSIRSLQGFEFNGLSNLRELYLQGNLISYIHNTTFAHLKSLEILNIAGNTVIDFPVWKLALNPYLVSLRLAENLWSCECHFTQQFTAWMRAFSTRISDIHAITCVSNEAAGPATTRMAEHEGRVCEEPMLAVAKTQVQEARLIENYLPLMIAVLASLSMLVIFAFVIFSFRHSIQIWISSKKDDSRVLDSRLDSPKSTYSETSTDSTTSGGDIFDAFVSYSPHDAMFVNQILGKELEATCGYRVCLHHRDLPATTAASETVGRVAEASRTTVLVLSTNYLTTEWPELDYRTGLLPLLQADRPVVVVLLGAADTALLYPGVRQLLAGRALLQWGEAQFWPRLQAALPRPVVEDSHYYSVCQFPSSSPPAYHQHAAANHTNIASLISHI